MDFFTVEHVLRMGIELSLGVCIKLFCDHGQIHWRDLVDDVRSWLPGAAIATATAHHEDDAHALAAK